MKQRIFGLLAAAVACLCALAFSACSLIGLQGEEENLLLQRNGDRTGYIVTGMKEERAEITVPASYNGLPVLAFGEGAFRNNKILRSVSFAAGSRVEAVSSGAFEGCANLQTIRLPDTVTAIGSRAFMFCTLLSRFTLPAGLEEVGVDAFAGDYRLAEVYNLSSLDLADSALAQSGIGRYARVVHTSADAESCLQTDGEGFLLFANAAEGDYCVLGYTGGNKTPLSLPASVGGNSYVVAPYAFRGCFGWTELTIPEAVTEIGICAFSDALVQSAVFEGTDSWDIYRNSEKIATVAPAECTGYALAQYLMKDYEYCHWVRVSS